MFDLVVDLGVYRVKKGKHLLVRFEQKGEKTGFCRLIVF